MKLYVALFCIFQVSCKCVSYFHNLKNKKERKGTNLNQRNNNNNKTKMWPWDAEHFGRCSMVLSTSNWRPTWPTGNTAPWDTQLIGILVNITKELMLLNCGTGNNSWESLGLQGETTNLSHRKSVLNVHWKDWCWSWNSNNLATWWEELTHWKRPWCW